MQNYLVIAYIVAWVGVCLYLIVMAMRLRGVRMELAATEELVREHLESLEARER
jgi:CcmD family protein